MMKKSVKVVFLLVLILLGIFLVSEKSNAVDFSLNYSKNTEPGISDSYKAKPGEEVWLSIDINNDTDEKIMAMYGSIEYDKNILELVNSEENSNSAIFELGDGWTIGDVSKEEPSDENSNIRIAKIMFYTTDENRSSTTAYIKFRIKDNTEVKSTQIKAKDIVLYNTKYKEIQEDIEDVTFNLKIYQTSNIVAIVTVVVIIVILIIVWFILSYKKNMKKTENKDLNIENEKIEENKSEKNDNNNLEKNNNAEEHLEEKSSNDLKIEDQDVDKKEEKHDDVK